MPATKVPSILIIDDTLSQVEGLANLIRSEGLAKVVICDPDEVSRLDVLRADLVLIDYDIAKWRKGIEPGEIISQQPGNGLALVPVLRSHIKRKVQPTAYAILTGKMDELADPLPSEYRNHALASINNLEWIFEKSSPGDEPRLYQQIAELAAAVRRLPRGWTPYSDRGSAEQLAGLLGLSLGTDESDELMQDVLRCHPPLYELSEWSHGLTILRWLLHRILPYPCFLLDTNYLAARLRLQHAGLESALQVGCPLRKALAPYEYDGILPTFLGGRWWRMGVERFLWNKTGGMSFDIASVRRLVNALAGEELPPSTPDDFPVVCIGARYESMKEFCSIDEAVRIRPDDWPAYAEQAWTTLELANEETKLKALVIEEDRERLG